MKTINFEKKKKELINKLTAELISKYLNPNICYFCKEHIKYKRTADKKYCKIREHFYYAEEYRGAAHGICNLKYRVSNEIPIVFLNGSNYDYHFIIK